MGIAEQPTHAVVQHHRLFSPAFVKTCSANFTFSVSNHLLFSTLPLYVLAVGGRESEIGLVVGAMAITSLAARPVVSGLIDRRGARAVLLAAGAMGLLSSFLYLFATGVAPLTALRLFQGLSVAGFTSSASVIVADVAPAHRRGQAMGLFGVSNNASMAIAPALGLVVANLLGYASLFLFCTGFAVVTLATIALLRDPGGRKSATARPWSLSTFYCPEALPAAVLTFSIYLTYSAVISFMPVYVQKHGVDNPGLFFTAFAISLVATRPVAALLSDKYGRAVVIAPGLLVTAGAMAGLSIASSVTMLVLVALLYGVGFGSAAPTLLAQAVDKIRPQNRPAGMSTLLIGLEAGMLCGSIAMGFVLEPLGYTGMFLLAASIPFLSLLGFLARHLLFARNLPDVEDAL